MNVTGQRVPASQGRATTTRWRFVSGTLRLRPAPSQCSRVAAVAAVLLAAGLGGVLPELVSAAAYVAVLAAFAAVVLVVAGAVLWSRPTMVVRAVTALAAGSLVLLAVLQVSVGLPGAAGLERLPVLQGTPLLLAPVVLVLLVVDAVRRGPDQAPQQPYAL